MRCPVCADEKFIGKSLGEGIYNTRSFQGKIFPPNELLKEIKDRVEQSPVAIAQDNAGDATILQELYEWMWEHLMKCHKDEFKGGELFKVVSEYKETA